jgi:hypothetical protein
MLITYFKDYRTLARYRFGLANLYLENFIVWLESRGYRRFTIRRHVREVVHFADWAEAEGLALRDSDRGALNRLVSQLAERNSLRYMRQAEADLPQCLSIDRLLGRGWCCGVSPSIHVDSRASASVAVQRMDEDAARHIGYYEYLAIFRSSISFLILAGVAGLTAFSFT